MKRRFLSISQFLDATSSLLHPALSTLSSAVTSLSTRLFSTSSRPTMFDFIEKEQELYNLLLPEEPHKGQKSREKLIEAMKRMTEKLEGQPLRLQGILNLVYI